MAFGDEVCLRRRVWPAHAQLMPRHSKGHTRLACKPSELEARRGQLEQEGRHFIPADVLSMHEQSSTGRTYTRDAYAPVCRDAHAEVEKLTACSVPGPFDGFFKPICAIREIKVEGLTPKSSAAPSAPLIFQPVF